MRQRAAFNLSVWVEHNQESLKPPVANKKLFDEETGMVIMVIGGPNRRTDYHDDPVDEFFYQLRGDMLLKVYDQNRFYDVPIREGEVFYLPPHVRHSPQRPIEESIGLVLEGQRLPGQRDGFEWFCFNCESMVHRVETEVKDITKDLPPLFDAFYASEKARTCPNCKSLHPGKDVPEGWVRI